MVSTGPSVVGMLFPPYPDSAQGLLLEVRLSDGVSWGAWTPIALCASIVDTFKKYQARVTLTRGVFPYRPALKALVGIVTS